MQNVFMNFYLKNDSTGLYYEGGEDEVSTEAALALVEEGTIADETLVWSQQSSFPFEGWTAWWQCSYVFGVGEAPDGGCTSLYYEVRSPWLRTRLMIHSGACLIQVHKQPTTDACDLWAYSERLLVIAGGGGWRNHKG
jgi:hypothetical protein